MSVEVLWFNKIVVVVSAGNMGRGPLYQPSNDPFVITVGAIDDHATVSTADDTTRPLQVLGLPLMRF